MATYEFRCRACGATFDQRRTMAEADAPATCPEGHSDTTRLLSVFASTSGSSSGRGSPMPSPPMGGGGCCGGSCGCG